jgi:hypothetical protein
MTDMIHRLVYYSRNHIEGDPASMMGEIDSILQKSRVNNTRDGITGALMFNAGCFAQVLEGPLDRVEAAFERIQQDVRHGDVSLLAVEPIAQRSFPNWAMGFVGASHDDATRFAGVAAETGFDPARMSGDQLHAILKELTLEEEKLGA